MFSEPEIRVIPLILNKKRFEGEKVKEFFKDCLIERSSPISSVTSYFLSSDYEVLIVAVIKKKGLFKEEWKVGGIIKEENNTYRLITKRSEKKRHSIKSEHIRDEFKGQVIKFYKDIKDVGFDSIFNALIATEFFDKEIYEIFPKLMIQKGFEDIYYSDRPILRLLRIIKKVIIDGMKLNFTSQELSNFTYTLESLNFIPLRSSGIDIRVNVLMMLRILYINNFADFDEFNMVRIRNFITKNRNTFLKDIDYFNKTLKKDPRKQMVERSLSIASQDRIDFLNGITLFDPSKVKVEDIAEVLNYKNSKMEQGNAKLKTIDYLKNKKNNLNKIIKQQSNEQISVEYVKNVNALSDLQKEINFQTVVEEVKESLKIGKYIIDYNECIKDKKILYTENLIEALILYSNLNNLSELEAMAILTIFLSSENSDYDDIPINILNVISNNNAYHLEIIKFGLEKNLQKPTNFSNFMMKILLINENTETHLKVVEVCRKYDVHLSTFNQTIVDIEEAIFDILAYIDIEGFITIDDKFEIIMKIKELIYSNHRITQNMFNFFQFCIEIEGVFEILEKAILANLQKIPKFLIEFIVKELNEGRLGIRLPHMKVIHLLVKRNIVKLNICEKCLAIEDYLIRVIQDGEHVKTACLIIYSATENGEVISGKLKDVLKTVEDYKEISFLLNSFLNPLSNYLQLVDAKLDEEKKKEILTKLEPEDFSRDIVRILIEFTMYNRNLKICALNALITVIPENFDFTPYDVAVVDLVYSVLNAGLNYDILSRLVSKTNITVLEIFQSLSYEDKETLQSIIMQPQLETKITFLSNSNYKQFFDYLDEKLKNENLITNRDMSILTYTLEDPSLADQFDKIVEFLEKCYKIETLSSNCQSDIYKLLVRDNDHPKFDKLLLLLTDKDKANAKELKENLEDKVKKINQNLLDNPDDDKLVEILNLVSTKIPQSCLEDLKLLCLNDKLKIPVKIKFLQILLKFVDKIKDFENFIDKVQSSLTKELDDELKSKLTTALKKQKPVGQLHFLVAYGLAIMYGVPINIEVLEEEDIPFEIACRTLFFTVKYKNDSELTEVFDLIDDFKEKYSKHEEKKYEVPAIEMISQILIKLNGGRMNVEYLNDLLVMLNSNEEVYNYFVNDVDDLKRISKLAKIWLNIRLYYIYKAIDQEEIDNLMIMLDYPISLIEKLLKIVNITIDPQDLYKCFILLKESSMTEKSKEDALKQLLKLSCDYWLEDITSQIVYNITSKSLKYFEDSDKEFDDLCFELIRLCHIGWSEIGLIKLLSKINSKDDMIKIIEPLRIIYEFQIKEYHLNLSNENTIEMFLNTKWSDLKHSIYQSGIQNAFHRTKEKNFDELIQEIGDLNRQNPINYIVSSKIIDDYEKVIAKQEAESIILPNAKIIKNWNMNDLKEWAKIYRPHLFITKNTDFSNNTSLFVEPDVPIEELIAVIMQGIFIKRGYWPRSIQVLSLLCLLNPIEDKGRLMQINTGEGKTIIVAMLATIKALKGHMVDIVTSSSELAKPQANELESFYNIFGLTSSHNSEDTVDKNTRYKANIVYGAANDFQADILREEYSKESIKSGRKCDLVIVDEADSMMIDGRNYIVMLSSQMPAMNYLEPILAAIWLNLGQHAEYIKEIDGKFYFIKKDIKPNEDETELIRGESDEAHHIDLNTYAKEILLKNIKDMLEGKSENIPPSAFDPNNENQNVDSTPLIKIPTHLKDFILNHQLEMWVNSAIHAKFFSKNRKNYLLNDEKKIVPIDSDNTGVLQKSMNWSNGLHQFLQFKHGCQIVPETITTNYISNISYFRRYKSNIYGMTGTLGSNTSRDFIHKVYNLDSIIIPPFKIKRYKELSPLIVRTGKEWYKEIVKTNLRHLRSERAVLIITKYISEAEEIRNAFIEKGYNEKQIRTYKTDNDSAVVRSEVDSGDLIIATNIAGRGTDIKAHPTVEDNGGLHVCVTFLPPNERVEYQNVGRTARTGNKGTAQFIIQEKKLTSFRKMKMLRNYIEELDIQQAQDEVKKTLIKDEVFELFCKLLLSAGDEFTKKGIEERFGIWIAMNEKNANELLTNYEKFKKVIESDLESKEVIKNPCYYIQEGVKHAENGEFDQAINSYDKAISLDQEFAENAFYNRGCAQLQKNCGNSGCGDIKSTGSYIKSVIRDFEESRKRIENRKLELQLIQEASSIREKNILSDQVSRKLILYSIQETAINSAIGITQEEYDRTLKNFDKQRKDLNDYHDKMKQNNLSEATSKENEFKENLDKINENEKNFKDQNPHPLKGIIRNAIQIDHGIKFEKFSIVDSFPNDEDINLFNHEIAEFSANGFIGKFEITDFPPINWGHFFAVLAIGLGQIIGGVLLCVFTCGAAGLAFGRTLISEGISDCITAVKDCLINRNFNWAEYGLQKAISITASILLLGISGLKDVGKTMFAGAKTLAKSAITETAKSGFKTAIKIAAVSVVKEVTQELIQPIFDEIIDKALIQNMYNEIQERVIPWIKDKIKNLDIITRMIKVDLWRGNVYFKSVIVDTVNEILHGTESWMNTWYSKYGYGVVKRYIEGKFSFMKYAFQAGTLCYELLKALPSLIEKLVEKLKFEQLQNLEKIEKNIKEYKIEETKEEQAYTPVKKFSIDDIAEDLSHAVTYKISNSITQNIIKPFSNQLVNAGIDRIYKGCNDRIENKLENIRAHRRIVFAQSGDSSKRLDKKYKKIKEKDKEALTKAAKDDIDNFEGGGMAGIRHMGSISEVIGKPIKILDENGKTIDIVGKQRKGEEPIEVQYQPPSKNRPKGHFAMPDGSDPPNKYNNNSENDCLFNVIASQTDHPDPNKIRSDSALKMNENIRDQIIQQYDIDRLRRYKSGKYLYEGGAINEYNRYIIPETHDYAVGLDNALNIHNQGKSVNERINESDIQGGVFKSVEQKINKLHNILKQINPIKKRILEINHIPPSNFMKIFNFKRDDTGCLVIPNIDHHGHKHDDGTVTSLKTFSTSIGSSEYNTILKDMMGVKHGDQNKIIDPVRFVNVLKLEILDNQLTAIKNKTSDLKQNFEPLINAYENNIINPHTNNNVLSREQAGQLREFVRNLPGVTNGDFETASRNIVNYSTNFFATFDQDMRGRLNNLFNEKLQFELPPAQYFPIQQRTIVNNSIRNYPIRANRTSVDYSLFNDSDSD